MTEPAGMLVIIGNRLTSHLTSAALNGSHVETKGSVVDEALREQVVDRQRVRGFPTVEIRAGTHDSNSENLAGGSNSKNLLADPGTFQEDWH